MAYRFTNTDKWKDVWFRKLKPSEKLLFCYLYDNCDIAGFIEMDIEKWAFDTGHNSTTIKGALKGLERGLIYSDTDDCIFIRNFLKHQKNLPINYSNSAHRGILKRFELYGHKFGIELDYESISSFVEGASKGLQRGYGNGNGNNNSYEDSNIEQSKKVKGWRDDFEIYLEELRVAYKKLLEDEKWIAQQERLNPGLDIRLSVEKASLNFWAKEAGWKKKKQSRTANIDWPSTFANAITMPMNRVWKPK